MKTALLLSLFLAISLASCVQFDPLPMSATISIAAYAGRSLDDPDLRAFLTSQYAGGAWTSDKLALAAAYFNGDVAVTRAQAVESAAGITTAGQRPNPVLSFSPGYNTSSFGISPWILSPSLDIPIETAGKRAKRIDQALAEAESAQLLVSAAAWQARVKVRDAMLKLYGGNETTILLKREIALRRDSLTKLGRQVDAGEVAGFELTQARLGANRAELALRDAEKISATSTAQLASEIGIPASALNGVSLDFSSFRSFPSVPDAAARKKALTHRSDLLAALADYKVSEAALRLEVAKQYPDVHLGPGYEFDQGDNKWHLGLSVELPLLNQNGGAIQQAEARRKTAAAKVDAKQAAVSGEVQVALAAYRAAQEKTRTAAKLAAEAAHASETTRAIVEAGELGPLDLVLRRIEASASTLSHLEARLQAQEALGQLEAALQLPLH